MPSSFVRRSLTRIGAFTWRPSAFLVPIVYGALWFTFARQSFDWSAVVALLTLLMTFFIQRAEHRDTQAVHAKLDELLRAHSSANTGLTHLDTEEPEDIERHREDHRGKHTTTSASP